MTDQLVEILYFVSGGLLAPTLVLLMILLAGTLIMLGGLAREGIDRALWFRPWKSFLHELRTNKVSADKFYELSLIGYPARFQRLTRNSKGQKQIVQKCLEDIELDIARRLSRLTFSTRLGPMLGLVGTLVPLGPALTGLASGDIQALSGNLVIAFTTTVFGILVGGFAFAASMVRRSWYEQDLSDLDFVTAFGNAFESDRNFLPDARNGHETATITVKSTPVAESNHA